MRVYENHFDTFGKRLLCLRVALQSRLRYCWTKTIYEEATPSQHMDKRSMLFIF